MNIAIVAWGSLIWHPGTLRIVDNFKPGGPLMPLEFSRVSGDGRLTLVIDESVGNPCATYFATSSYDGLNIAADNLKDREGMNNRADVGFVDIASQAKSARAAERHANTVEIIEAWAGENDFDAVIWTALASNFHKPNKAAEPFSVEGATRYLDRLDKLSFARALHYIWNAPSQVETPLRAAVDARWPERRAE